MDLAAWASRQFVESRIQSIEFGHRKQALGGFGLATSTLRAGKPAALLADGAWTDRVLGWIVV
jgi:hypothetical protein